MYFLDMLTNNPAVTKKAKKNTRNKQNVHPSINQSITLYHPDALGTSQSGNQQRQEANQLPPKIPDQPEKPPRPDEA